MESALLGYMARDQHGETIHMPNTKFPRAELLKRLGKTSATRLFIDGADGRPKHIGYVVGRRWFTILEVREWDRGPA
jgi:hypothetical protein